jgi:hypothetical protein
VHKDNERKRKRELAGDDDEKINENGDGVEKPREGLKPAKPQKKQKIDAKQSKSETSDVPVDEAEALRRAEYVRKRKEKRQAKVEKKSKAREKKEQKKAGVKDEKPVVSENVTVKKQDTKKQPKEKQSNKTKGQQSAPKKEVAVADEEEEDEQEGEDSDDEDELDESTVKTADLAKLDFSGLVEDDDVEMGADDEEFSAEEEDVASSEEEDDAEEESTMQPISIDGMDIHAEDSSEDDTEASPDQSPTFDDGNSAGASSSSSTTSTINPLLPEATAAAKPPKSTSAETSSKPHRLPEIDPALLQERLQARITALRAARKADGLDGRPARNRQELIEARRRKQEARKGVKKELRAKTRLAADAEAEAARLRGGSGSPLWSPALPSPRAEEANNFSFGKIAFDDGAHVRVAADDTTGGLDLVDAKARKGPRDVKTALEAALKKQNRLSGLDGEKRAELEEKDRWLGAKRRVAGERVRDDASLLKKTLKRTEKLKGKSEKEWGERIAGVKKGQEQKQRKREDNLKKRKDEKGVKGKAKAKGGAKSGGKKPSQKKRPGFEGSFKAGGGKK